MDSKQSEEKKYLLYNDTIELAFDDASHSYSVNDKLIDGTTSILGVVAKPALVPWAVKMTVAHFEKNLKPGVSYDEIEIGNLLTDAKVAYRRKSGDAASIGTMVHDWIKEYIAGNKPKMPINVSMQNAINAFLKWVKEHKVKFLESERLVYSKQHHYAGTLDFIAEVDGKIKLGDWKTSTGIWNEYLFQLAGYQQAYSEEFPDKKIAGGIIVRVGKDGVLEVKEVDSYKKDVVAFNAAIDIYRRDNELKAENPYIPKWKSKWKN